jgi:hypothetical protein
MASEREQLAQRMVAWLGERSKTLTAPTTHELIPRDEGPGYGRHITFGREGQMMEAIVWRLDRIDVRVMDTDEWFNLKSEQEFYDWVERAYRSTAGRGSIVGRKVAGPPRRT